MIFVLLTVNVFPTLTALFSMFRQVREDDVLTDWLKKFWLAYRQDWRHNWLLAGLFTLVSAVLTFDLLYVTAYQMPRFFAYIVGGLLALVVVLFLTCALLQASYQLSIKDLLWDAVYLPIRHLPRMLAVLVLVIGFFVITKATNWPLLQSTFAGLIALTAYWMLHPLLIQQEEQQNRGATDEQR
ncbi:DUF624 domain-containing protein [Lacticaseibacillus yichunensis]|uniref:DUF624 domain-containing protein n=1 Tax=Lacticaseibacillus yichunensis TaxID=2486015 RepID=UPI002989CB60|nr:DUF624 domain-containing protein [Lacticaseibacillus yichunensis]